MSAACAAPRRALTQLLCTWEGPLQAGEAGSQMGSKTLSLFLQFPLFLLNDILGVHSVGFGVRNTLSLSMRKVSMVSDEPPEEPPSKWWVWSG